jgi:glycosyltransferase involved in cell wall biosynthesis
MRRPSNGRPVVRPIAERRPSIVNPERVQRVLIAAHNHPAITRGGAEITAFHLFERLQHRPGFEAWFLGGQTSPSGGRMGAAITQPFSEREFVYTAPNFDWFKFANRDPGFANEFPALLRHLRPDVVHFHHFAVFGVEAFYHVRKMLPMAKIVLTFHEYLAICHHYGQMVTTNHNNLCYKSSQRACNACFPDISQSDFFLRELYIRRCLALADRFIAPSRFLAERLIAWGLLEHRVSIIENVIPLPSTPSMPPSADANAPLQIGFFGQISRLKGINVVLDCARLLGQMDVSDIVFNIHGDYRHQPPEFQTEFLSRLKDIGPNVHFHGPYDPSRVDSLMRSVDLVIVPSIWWENSPLVIQEAFRNRRPVICSDIGGMAEKVRHEQDGWHFPVGKPASLGTLLRSLAGNRRLIRKVAANIRMPPTVDDICDAHVHTYFLHSDAQLTS